ncbi:hypothetical protein [Brevibacterium atlanticum]|nr:hypothetical protein [Brevibacterium atlanticum]
MSTLLCFAESPAQAATAVSAQPEAASAAGPDSAVHRTSIAAPAKDLP